MCNSESVMTFFMQVPELVLNRPFISASNKLPFNTVMYRQHTDVKYQWALICPNNS